MGRDAVLMLEDGRAFRGQGFGADCQGLGEVVFNTSMTGYQEVLTDPSYAGQIVVMTHPQIGNYGTNCEDQESKGIFLTGFVVRECSPMFSNWRGQQTLHDYLNDRGIAGLAGIDTRSLVRHIRRKGAMRGILAAGSEAPESLRQKALSHPSMTGSDYVKKVTVGQRYAFDSGREDHRFHVVAYDYGIKTNILRSLAARGCRTTVLPASTPAEEALALQPDGIFLSNGPGDPEPVDYAVSNVSRLLGKKPIFGICLGHQILGLALGARTYKLKFGHRGGNQPVQNLLTRKVEITSHNHGFAVDADSLPDSAVQLTHVNLNDQTVEGLRHRSEPLFSVQYHPEASPGPHDSLYLFDEFVRLMEGETGWST